MSARLKPQILEEEIDQARLEYLLDISSDIIFFDGHFPEFPVLAGVVQLDWAIELAAPLNLTGGFHSVRRLKFMRPITYNKKIKLVLTSHDEGMTVKFKYIDDRFTYSSGRLTFGA